jgi:hypothetical protein
MWYVWERGEVHTVLCWGDQRGGRPLGRFRRKWENHINMIFQEVGWGGMDWNYLAQDRDRWRTVVNASIG